MPPVLTDYEYAYGETGFVLNADFGGNPNNLPFVDVTDITGLDSAPQRVNTSEREGLDGTYVDVAFQSMRTIVITGEVYASVNDPDTLVKALRAAYGNPAVAPFYFKHPSQSLQFCNAQGGGCKYDVDVNRRLGITNVMLTLLCGDPYIYDYPPNFASSNLNAINPFGRGFNWSFPTGFGSSIVLNEETLANYGTHTAYPIITLHGPLTNPVITDSISSITMALSMTMVASDTCVIDCRNKSIILNGTTSKRSSYNGLSWFSVPAATLDTIYLGASAGSGYYTALLYNTYY
jgi:Phage tail protein